MIPVKKIVLSLCLILLGASVLSGCTKDEVLDQYNNIVQSAGSIALTGNSSLQGTKEKGIDDYTGSYTANYEDFSDTEYLFGGTSIKREAGKDLSIDCALEVTDGTAKYFGFLELMKKSLCLKQPEHIVIQLHSLKVETISALNVKISLEALN